MSGGRIAVLAAALLAIVVVGWLWAGADPQPAPQVSVVMPPPSVEGAGSSSSSSAAIEEGRSDSGLGAGEKSAEISVGTSAQGSAEPPAAGAHQALSETHPDAAPTRLEGDGASSDGSTSGPAEDEFPTAGSSATTEADPAPAAPTPEGRTSEAGASGHSEPQEATAASPADAEAKPEESPAQLRTSEDGQSGVPVLVTRGSNLRAEASKASPILAHVKRGQNVFRLDDTPVGGYVPVVHGDLRGWIWWMNLVERLAPDDRRQLGESPNDAQIRTEQPNAQPSD